MSPGHAIVPPQLRDAIIQALANAVHPNLAYAQVAQLIRELGNCKTVEVEPAKPALVEGAAE